MEYPEDENTYNLSYQFMLGTDILVAPVYEPDKNKKMVYLPKGVWFNFFTGEEYEGNDYIVANSPLDTIPIFVKEGSIISYNKVQNYVGEKKLLELQFNIYLSDNNISQNSYQLYEDDGLSFAYQDNKYSLTELSYVKNKNGIEFNIKNKHDKYEKSVKKYLINIKNIKSNPANIMVDDRQINSWNYVNSPNELSLKVNKDVTKINITF
jgi:alpha-glucosidase